MTMYEPIVFTTVNSRSVFQPVSPFSPPMCGMQQHVNPFDGGSVETATELEDWDLLFRAVLETVARVAGETVATNGTALRLQAPGDVFRGCLEALDQLRKSVPLAQHSGYALPVPGAT